MTKVTEQELTEIQELRNSLYAIITATGELHLNKLLLQEQLADLNVQINLQEKNFMEFRQKEQVIYQQLQEKYGTGNINIETGEVTE